MAALGPGRHPLVQFSEKAGQLGRPVELHALDGRLPPDGLLDQDRDLVRKAVGVPQRRGREGREGDPCVLARLLEGIGVDDLRRLRAEDGERVADERLRAITGHAPARHALYLGQHRLDRRRDDHVHQPVPVGNLVAVGNPVEAIEHLQPPRGLPLEPGAYLDEARSRAVALAHLQAQPLGSEHHRLFEEVRQVGPRLDGFRADDRPPAPVGIGVPAAITAPERPERLDGLPGGPWKQGPRRAAFQDGTLQPDVAQGPPSVRVGPTGDAKREIAVRKGAGASEGEPPPLDGRESQLREGRAVLARLEGAVDVGPRHAVAARLTVGEPLLLHLREQQGGIWFGAALLPDRGRRLERDAALVERGFNGGGAR